MEDVARSNAETSLREMTRHAASVEEAAAATECQLRTEIQTLTDRHAVQVSECGAERDGGSMLSVFERNFFQEGVRSEYK